MTVGKPVPCALQYGAVEHSTASFPEDGQPKEGGGAGIPP